MGMATARGEWIPSGRLIPRSASPSTCERRAVSTPQPEIHLFLLWENALPHANRILRDIGESFSILEVVRVEWNPGLFARNLTRFYGQALPPGSDKERQAGNGPFLVVVVDDADPVYAEREMWGRPATVNARMFDAKQRYRKWAGDGHRVHATIKASETDHDLFFVLGRRLEFYERQRAERWGGVVRQLRADPIGTDGWRDPTELFTAIDVTLGYVVLDELEANGGALPSHVRILVEGAWEHWGVEWLVASPDLEREGAHRSSTLHEVVVGGETTTLELRHVGDGYFDESWQRAMLRERVPHSSGAFTLSPEHAFHGLLYHALVHHPDPPRRYASVLSALAGRLSLPAPDLDDPGATKRVIDAYLAREGYDYTVPDDPSVHFNAALVGTRRRLDGPRHTWADRFVRAAQRARRAD